ncbi:MAG: type III secretion system inner rod subunit SctI [Microvirgula sp.]
MDIQPLATTLEPYRMNMAFTPVAAPDPDSVNAFAHTLSGPGRLPLPEAIATDRLQARAREIGDALAGVRGHGDTPGHPADMLMVQAALLKSLIEVDLMAKTAGSLSQGINKLVSMQ